MILDHTFLKREQLSESQPLYFEQDAAVTCEGEVVRKRPQEKFEQGAAVTCQGEVVRRKPCLERVEQEALVFCKDEAARKQSPESH